MEGLPGCYSLREGRGGDGDEVARQWTASEAGAVDAAVEASETGMLLHNFDQDPSDPHKLVWTEVYGQSEDFLFHADNPPVLDYVEKHAALADDFTIEIYGTVSQAVIDKINALEVPLQYFQTSPVGYFRPATFKV